MNDKAPPINWENTTFEGSRREQLRRARAMTVRQRLEALNDLSDLSQRMQAMPKQAASETAAIREQGAEYDTAATCNEIVLSGCAPTPLAAYLKALGVLRLVTEQADPSARGYWRNEAFVLVTALDAEDLRRFLLESYVPTPVLAPWNGGSGFYSGDNQSGIGPIEAAAARRLATLRDDIKVVRTILLRLGMETKPEGEGKAALLGALRAELSDAGIAWLDAAVLLTEQTPKYPPLLGTGGNDGRLDFTNNFMQRVVALIDPDTGHPAAGAASRLKVSLFGEAEPGLPSAAVGQFSPGAAGGPNQTAGFEGKALVNPWDFILMLEGALLFAAAATRRLEDSIPGALSYPFTVRATGAGAGSASLSDEAKARHEIWVPLWEAPSTLAEIRALLAEGRVTMGRRPARDGLDVARAVSRLGVERGITAFQRYAFLMRAGKAYFATPLNRIPVRRNHAGDIIAELDADGWLGKFRRLGRTEGTARVRSLVRRLEDALFALASVQSGIAGAVQQVMTGLGEVQRYLAVSPKAREACPPVPALSERWVAWADDGSPEFAVAAALGSLHARSNDAEGTVGRRTMFLRNHVAPEHYQRGRFVWDDSAGHRVTWAPGALESNLVSTVQRRLLESDRSDLADKPFEFTRPAPLAAVAAWLGGELDDTRLASLVSGLMLARVPRGPSQRVQETQTPLPAAYRLLKPFFCTNAQLRRAGLLPGDAHLPIPPEMIRRLSAGQTAKALHIATRQLRARGLADGLRGLGRDIADFPDGRRLLAALLVPINDRDLRGLIPGPVPQIN